jgi:endonuclease-3
MRATISDMRRTPLKSSTRGDQFPLQEALRVLRGAVRAWKPAAVTELRDAGATPFMILISTLLSLRTKDLVTARASARLFALARTPASILKLDEETIAKAIRPVGFYRTKARTLLEISRVLLEKHGGVVPSELDDLLRWRGVGRKTANLVLTLGFGKPGICVDTHVHRILNRWGCVRTSNPEETEFALREILPKRYWIPINDWLVTFGQRVCAPVSPRCSICPLGDLCGRRGVTRSR